MGRVCVCIFVILYCFVVPLMADTEVEKRLILHSDADFANALQNLSLELEKTKTQIQNVTNAYEKRIADLEAKLQITENDNNGHGSVYTRWGRTTCPSNGTELVYTGYTAGSDFNKAGTAADYICISDSPLWGVYEDSANSDSPLIYGTEYQFRDQFTDSGTKFFGQDTFDHDAPCAVCRSNRPSTVMIPGRNQCYPGWTKEYAGYLVSGYNGQVAPTNYACLDSRPEAEAGDYKNNNGKLMYIAEAQCGSLRCPPYVQNREITCVVCSK